MKILSTYNGNWVFNLSFYEKKFAKNENKFQK